jgi:DNA polymerase I
MAKRLPKHLKGPFVNAIYDRRKATIYLKREDGQYVTTTAYPSFFMRTKDVDSFPMDEFKKDILDTMEEGRYTRLLYDPQIHYKRKRAMIDICEEEGVKLFEADVSPIRRWFSDTGSTVTQKFRCLFFDLETHPLKLGFDDDAKKQHRIISFAAYDEEGNSWFVAANESSRSEEAKVIKEFLKIAKDYDVLLAWNGNDYDFFVLKARCKNLKIKVDWRDWSLLDHMLAVKKALMSISDVGFKRSFALDAIGTNVLGIKKIKLTVPPGKMHLLLGERVAELERYNRRDVEIMLKIEEKREFLKLHFALCSICRTFPNQSSIFPNELADGILLRLGIQENRHFPTRRGWEEDKPEYVKYEGAFVMDPRVGFHTGVQVPDFASLYPSIILSWNMSRETMLRDGRHYPPEVEADNAHATATGVRFRTDFEGMLPRAVRRLMMKRKEYANRAKQCKVGSDEWKSMNNLSTAVKVVTNSFYGLLGAESSRYHEREIARSITLTGQLLIHEMMQYFERKGYKSIYGDSVTKDRTTIIKIDNEINIVTFEELWNLVDSFERVRNDGKETKHVRNIQTLAVDKDHYPIWCDIKQIIRHKTDKTTYHISNPYGQTEVTEDHSISSGGEFITPIQLIKENRGFDTVDAIAPDQIDTIDLYSYLWNIDYECSYKQTWIRYQFDVTGHLYNQIRVIGFGSNTDTFTRYFDTSNKEKLYALLRVLAAYITEGSASIRGLTTSRWMFSICQNDTNWLNELLIAFNIAFPNLHVSQPINTGGDTYAIRNSTASASLFFSSLCGYKSKNKKIPSFVYRLDNDAIRFFINCLVEGDGHIESSGQFSYTSNSQKLIAGISYLMSMIGIKHSFKYRSSKKAWTIRTFSNKRRLHRHKTNIKTRTLLSNEYVYDLEVKHGHTFVDAVGRVVLHNTDSVFVKCTPEEMTAELDDINNKFLPWKLNNWGCRECAVKLDFDKGFETLIMVTKKRYAGRLALHKGRKAPRDMDPEVKGIEVQRSDQGLLAQKLLKKFINMMVKTSCDPIMIDEEIRREGQEFFTRPLKKEEIQITKSVQKHPSEYHPKTTVVRVAEKMIEEGAEFFIGMKVPYIVVAHKPNVEGIHADKYDGNCDRVYYWTRTILPPILRLLEVRFPGYNFNNFKVPNQGILDFFGDNDNVQRKRRIRIPKQIKRRIRKPVK